MHSVASDARSLTDLSDLCRPGESWRQHGSAHAGCRGHPARARRFVLNLCIAGASAIDRLPTPFPLSQNPASRRSSSKLTSSSLRATLGHSPSMRSSLPLARTDGCCATSGRSCRYDSQRSRRRQASFPRRVRLSLSRDQKKRSQVIDGLHCTLLQRPLIGSSQAVAFTSTATRWRSLLPAPHRTHLLNLLRPTCSTTSSQSCRSGRGTTSSSQ